MLFQWLYFYLKGGSTHDQLAYVHARIFHWWYVYQLAAHLGTIHPLFHLHLFFVDVVSMIRISFLFVIGRILAAV